MHTYALYARWSFTLFMGFILSCGQGDNAPENSVTELSETFGYSKSGTYRHSILPIFVDYQDKKTSSKEAILLAQEKVLILQKYYQDVSYGMIDINPDKNADGQPDYAVVNMPFNQPSDRDFGWADGGYDVINAALYEQTKIKVEEYNIPVYITHHDTAFASGYVNSYCQLKSQSSCRAVFFNFYHTDRLWIHEIGHLYGMKSHSSSNFGSYVEYGNAACPMGSSWDRSVPSGPQLDAMGRFQVAPYQKHVLRVTPNLDDLNAPQSWDFILDPVGVPMQQKSTRPIFLTLNFIQRLERNHYASGVSDTVTTYASRSFENRKRVGLDQSLSTEKWPDASLQGLFTFAYNTLIQTNTQRLEFSYKFQYDINKYPPPGVAGSSERTSQSVDVKYVVELMRTYPDQSVLVHVERVF